MIKGSSSTYIDALVRCYPPHEIHTSTPVQSLGEDKNGMWLKTSSGKKYFDHVILTTSAEDALTIMSNSVSEEDSDILGCFKTDKNIVVLHSDMSVFYSFSVV
jgi:predicted NAD/FAD-binding protein